MRRTPVAGMFLSFLALVVPVTAQEPTVEYGHPSELRGVTKIFVDTGLYGERREAIIKEIRKHAPVLEVASRPEESDVHLRFLVKETESGKTESVGSVVRVLDKDRVRVLFSYEDKMPPIFERESPVNFGLEYAKPQIFARMFVMAYKKANS